MDRRAPSDIVVIGAGPAGLCAAEVLARAGHRVTVYDRMPSVGRKFLIAGRGGLNLTHSEALPDFLARYQPAAYGLRMAIEAFPPDALREWCHGLGQPTFVGSSGRVFPESFKASPLLRAWLAHLDGLGVRIRTRHRFVGWSREGIAFETPDGPTTCPPGPTVLAMGGASWPRLGSDGAWVAILEGLGMTVAPLRPANVGFTVAWSEHFRTRFAGEPLKRIALSFDGASVRGEALVTADGIEGGAVYALSRKIREAFSARGHAMIHLDLRPDLSQDALARRLSDPKPGQSRSTTLRKAAGLGPVATGLLHEASHRALPEAAGDLAGLIKAVPLRLGAPRPIERAISTAGGVAFASLDERFMLLAKPGTFVAGEMLDWEAPTGGYLLQGAFATGRAAAQGLLGWLAEGGVGPGS